MPDLTGLTLTEAQERVAGLDAPATVVFPAEEHTRAIAAQHIAGVQKPARVETFAVAARELELRMASTDHYLVGSQTPQAGEVFTTTDAITLEAVPGWSDESPWPTIGHAVAVEEDGPVECFTCHTPDKCSDCHTGL